MSILAWSKILPVKELKTGEAAVAAVEARVKHEEKVLAEVKKLASRARASRARNGYGRALRKALGGP